MNSYGHLLHYLNRVKQIQRQSACVIILSNVPVSYSCCRQQLEFFGNMRKSGHLVDICFEVSSDEDPTTMVKFHAHRLVLALRSPVFAAMFTNNMKEAHNASIQLKDVTATTLQALLDYIYADTIPSLSLLSVPRLIDVLNAAHCYLLGEIQIAYLMPV
jgi:hypothetical protein